ncbi:hypothetical protein D9M71_515450 [compost metagenome]
MLQALQGLLLVQGVELAFMGIDAAHEVFAGRARWWAVVGMVEAMQGQFVAAGQAPLE